MGSTINIKQTFFIVFIATIILMLMSIGVSQDLTSAVADSSEPVFIATDEVTISHLTDSHYFPLRFCHNEDEGIFQEEMLTDSKLLIECSKALEWSLQDIIANPTDYLIVSGDNTKDGSLASHVDVANGLRFVQNEIRKISGYEDFQIFVQVGNHDLYNNDSKDFSGDGLAKNVAITTRSDIEMVYAGLGYPDIDETTALAYYQDKGVYYDSTTLASLPPMPYAIETGEDSYIHSTNATNIDYTYITDTEYNPAGFTGDDYGCTSLTYIADVDIDNDAADNNDIVFLAIDCVKSNPIDGHVVGSSVTEELLAFLENETPDKERKISITHHPLLEQMPMVSTLLKDFVIEDYIVTSGFLADVIGVRYNLTGHMHSNSITHRLSFGNNEITDIESASLSSYCGGVRTLTLEYGTLGSVYAEDLPSDYRLVGDLDFNYLIDERYITTEYLEYNLLDGFINSENICTDFKSYARQRVYDNIVTNLVGGYLTPTKIDSVINETLLPIIPESISLGFINIDLTQYTDSLPTIINNLITEIDTKVLADYTYGGTNPLFTGGENKTLAYVEELLDSVINTEVNSQGFTIIDLFFACYYTHINGTLYSTYESLPEAIREGLANMQNGTVIKTLIENLLDEETGLYKLLVDLISTELDLSAGLSEPERVRFNGLFNTLKTFLHLDSNIVLTIDHIVLEDLIAPAASLLGLDLDIGESGVVGLLDSYIDSYLTSSFYTGLGGIASDIMVAFAVDESANVDYENTLHILRNANQEVTYLDTIIPDVATIANGKAPSLLTVTFGEDSTSDKSFVWFTDTRIDSSVVVYSASSDLSNPTTVTGEFAIYAYEKAMIDIGVFATTQTDEIGRHQVNLSGLTPNTTYYYKVGAETISDYGIVNYFSNTYSFKTAPAGNESFEIMLTADMQGYTQIEYDNIMRIFNNVDEVFPNGIDLIIDMGDSVDNSDNMKQYGYLLDTDQEFWGNVTIASASGNHEDHYFEVDEDYVPSSSAVITSEYNSGAFHYGYPNEHADETGIYYSYDYSNVHFTVLNTNDVSSGGISNEQVEWLENDLANTTCAYKVVYMHKSIYSNGSHSFDSDVIAIRAQLTPIFAEYGVSLVLGGHDHTYNESYYIDGNGNEIKGSQNGKNIIGEKGTLYVTLGTIGSKFYGWRDNELLPTAYGEELHDPTLANPVFGKLSYDGENLYYQAYEYDLATDTISEISVEKNFVGYIIAIVAAAVIMIGLGIVIVIKKKKIMA